MQHDLKIILGTIAGTILAFYCGAMFNFFPFPGDDLLAREIGFCTLIICTVVAICTCMILRALKEKKTGKPQEAEHDEKMGG